MRAAVLLFGALVVNNSQQNARPQADAVPIHVSNSFHFNLDASLARVAPLFGPDGERIWAGEHWNPQFVYPQPGKDIQGAVFRVDHGSHNSVWVNTVFNVFTGKMQYVYFVPERLVTIVTVKLTVIDKIHTNVEVTYDRTAVTVAANDDVRTMGRSDRENGPRWRDAIEAALAHSPK